MCIYLSDGHQLLRVAGVGDDAMATCAWTSQETPPNLLARVGRRRGRHVHTTFHTVELSALGVSPPVREEQRFEATERAMNFQMLDVLRHSGDRFVWDFHGLPSLTESCKRHGIINKDWGVNLDGYEFVGDIQIRWFPTAETNSFIQGLRAWFMSLSETGIVSFTYGRKAMGNCFVKGATFLLELMSSLWNRRLTHARHGIRSAWHGSLVVWHYVPGEIKLAGLAYVVWRCCCLLRSDWQQQRTIFDGQDNIAFCAVCTPELLDDNVMVLGNAYEKKFHVPAACSRCSRIWRWRGWKEARIRIGNSHYQFLGTYTALRMQRERDVHCPAVNQLDIPNEYRFVHRLMQLHGGTIGAMENRYRLTWSEHTNSYCLSTQWKEVVNGDATRYRPPPQAANNPPAPDNRSDTPPTPKQKSSEQAKEPAEPTTPAPAPADAVSPGITTTNAYGGTTTIGGSSGSGHPAPAPDAAQTPPTTNIQQMRELWQFVYDNHRYYPQSTLMWSSFERCRELLGPKSKPLTGVTAHYRMGILGVGSRILDSRYMKPPPGMGFAPMPLPSAQAVGPVTHPATVHNSKDKPSVAAILEGRSSVKKSVFQNADGEYPDLAFNKSSKAAQRLNKFWRRFFQVCLTDKAIDNAYHKLFAGKTFKEIAMSKFSQEEVEAIQVELQTTSAPERIGTRKANGKLEAVLKSGKPGRVVVDNTLQLLAINIISTSIFQHILFDHDDGIFYNMSIKHRSREDVLDAFGKMMQDPFNDKSRRASGREPKVPETCTWEIDQTGMELHERCNRHGEGLLGYTYNALMRINRRVSHKVNGEFTNLHEAKIVYDVKTGMRIRFRIKCSEVPKETWFTAKFPDMYLDSGWALTSGVNFVNELSGVFSSVTENPEHLFAFNTETNKFRLQDGTFDWQFLSIPLYQTLASTQPSSFKIYLRGLFEGDDGGGAGSKCLADERNGGPLGLIIREQEDLGYSAKLKTIVDGRLEIIGAHFPVRDGFVCDDVPWIPAVQRYTSKLGLQTNINITPSSKAARFLSLASMFAGRNEPLQRGFELSAINIIDENKNKKDFWTTKIKTDGHHEIDRAFGNGLHCTYTMEDVKAHYDRCANKVHQTSDTQIRMLNMSIACDVGANVVTRDDFAKLGLFAEECRKFCGDDEAAYSFLPASFR